MDRMVNYIRLACMLRTYNSTIEFSKYEFNNKLLIGVTLLGITSCVTLKSYTFFMPLDLSRSNGQKKLSLMLIF